MSGASARAQSNRTLLAALFATVAMLFASFAAAFLEQRGTGWQTVALPDLLWINTAILLVSSVTLEIGRRRGARVLLRATLVLGLLFLAGQVAALMELRGQGVYLASSRYASFFYLLTLLHGLHLIGGLAALGYGLARPAAMRFCAGFWHFLGAIWIYVLGVLLVL